MVINLTINFFTYISRNFILTDYYTCNLLITHKWI